jgi:nitrate reductase NapE
MIDPADPGRLHMADSQEKSSELKAFLFLTVVMAPALAGAVIASYGLAVWIYQMFAGPPTG